MDEPAVLPPCESLFEGNPLALALLSHAGEVLASNTNWRMLIGTSETGDRVGLLRALDTSRSTRMRASCEVHGRAGERLLCSVWIADDYRMWASVEPPSDRSFELLRELINRVPINVYACDMQGICLLSEGGLLEMLGMKPGANVGADVFATADMVPGLGEAIRGAFAGRTSTIEFQFMEMLLSQTALPWREGDALLGAFCIVSDITARRRDEDRLREQVGIIQAQQAAISLLSTPIIDVGDGVLAAPLIGQIDGERARNLMESLLGEIARKRARYAVLDLTGVDTIEAESAAHVIRIIRGVGLLGAEAIVTGIRPPIARTMIALGLDMSAIFTLRSLSDALRHCAERSGR
jgi:rsbT co-antagonist protein RsbR